MLSTRRRRDAARGEHLRDPDPHRSGADDRDAPRPEVAHSDASNKASSSAAPISFGEPDEESPLVERSLDDRGAIVLGIPELAQPRRRADVREQALERHRQVVAAVEQPGRGRAPLRDGILDKAEDGRRCHCHSETVRDQRRPAVARRLPFVLEGRDRVGERVGDVHAGRREGHPGDRRRKRHLRTGLDVAAVRDGSAEGTAHQLDRALAEWIRERIRTLVGRPLGERESRAVVVRRDGVRLERVEQRVDADRRRDAGRARQGQSRVDDRDGRPEVLV